MIHRGCWILYILHTASGEVYLSFDAKIGWMPACATHAPNTDAVSHDPILEIPIVSMEK